MAEPICDYDEKVLLPVNDFFSVKVNGEKVDLYSAVVDMRDKREAAVGVFDFEGEAEIEVTCVRSVNEAVIRPKKYKIVPELGKKSVRFKIDRPMKLTLETEGDCHRCLHLIAGEKPNFEQKFKNEIRFERGVHFIGEGALKIPSDTDVFIEGGAIVIGSLVCENVKNVHIYGRGVIWMGLYHRFTSFMGIRLSHSENVVIEGITIINPPHYSISIGESKNIKITDVNAFSCEGWSDGIDMMSSENVDIDNIFFRNSDDCIAIYADRWDNFGDTRNVSVRNSILWADVAHAVNIGLHGRYDGEGRVIENITVENVDILEHRELQTECQGALAINVGDNNTVRNAAFRNICVERMSRGRLFDIRVLKSPCYNPAPGKRIENVVIENIESIESELRPRISGFDKDRKVCKVTIKNVREGGKRLWKDGVEIGKYAEDICMEE